MNPGKYLAALVIFAVSFICAVPVSTQAQWPTVNQALQQIEDWPLYREGVISGQTSSSDQTGGDADGTGYLHLEPQDSLYVIFDQDGPGCVYRLWIRNIAGASSRYIRIYFDNHTSPDINTTVGNLFSGLYSNFLSPIAGNGTVSSGGNYCYLPLPFTQHLKIALVGGILPHQVSYQLYPPGTAILPYTQAIPSTILQQWLNTGSDPKSAVGNITSSGNLIIAPNQSQTLFTFSGSGSITGLRLIINPSTLSVLQSLRLRCWWDNSALPQLDCSVGAFFGNSLGFSTVAGLPLGVQGGQFYCYFPMPFWQNARIELQNTLLTTSVDIGYTLTNKTEAYSQQSGYFCATQRPYMSSQPGQDLILSEISGHGQLAGMTVTLISTAGTNFLHGDLRVYADGLASPLMQGTDFDGDVNAGNYFAGSTFSKPVHGAPFIQNTAEQKVCAYRFFLGDLVPFASCLSLRAEHGNRNTIPLTYSSVIYSYCRPEIALIASDELDVGDVSSELEHSYSAQGGQTSQSHAYAYPGTFDNQYFSDGGRTIFGSSNFTVGIEPDNHGVRLVRLKDASIFPQKTVVRVNGDSLGLWSDPDYNYYKRWGHSIYEIPVQYTAGQSQLQISLTNQTGSQGWTEYKYWVYTHIPPRADIIPPSQVTNLMLTTPENGATMRLTWDAATDNNGVSAYRIYRGTNPGVQPTSQYLVGETPLTIFTNSGLNPGTWYYYIVSAVDFSGNQGNASAENSARTSSSYLFENELLTIAAKTVNDTAYAQQMIGFGENWSNQAQIRFEANAIGDFFTQNFTVTTSDTYDVAAYFTKGPGYGIAITRLDGQALGSSVDLYAPLVQRSAKVDLGTLFLDARTHQVTFQVVNKNNASSDYDLGVDDILLTSHYLLGVTPGESAQAPREFRLFQNYPNPFNASTDISYKLQATSQVRLTVWDTAGRLVTTLIDGRREAGMHQVTFNGKGLASGLYFVKMEAGGFAAIKKMILLK